jgi:hypothetical protein
LNAVVYNDISVVILWNLALLVAIWNVNINTSLFSHDLKQALLPCVEKIKLYFV